MPALRWVRRAGAKGKISSKLDCLPLSKNPCLWKLMVKSGLGTRSPPLPEPLQQRRGWLWHWSGDRGGCPCPTSPLPHPCARLPHPQPHAQPPTRQLLPPHPSHVPCTQKPCVPCGGHAESLCRGSVQIRILKPRVTCWRCSARVRTPGRWNIPTMCIPTTSPARPDAQTRPTPAAVGTRGSARQGSWGHFLEPALGQ